MLPIENRNVRGGTLRYTTNQGSPQVYTDQICKSIVFSSSSVDGDFINPNPFSFTKNESSFTYVSGTKTATRKSTGIVESKETWNGAAGDSVIDSRQLLPPATLTFLNEKNAAYAKAQARLVNMIQNSDLNAAVAAAESPELLKLRGQLNNGFSWQKVKRLAKRTPFLGAATLVSDAWLLWTFALKPTINDAWNLANFVATSSSLDLVRVHASASERISYSSVNNSVHSKTISVGNVKTKFGIYYSISDPTVRDLARLGLLNPALYFWERLPFSFVVDYVFNIGSYLSNVESAYAVGLTFHSGWQTDTYRVSSTSDFAPWFSESPYYYFNSTISGTTSRIQAGCTRSKLTSFPSARPPSLDLDLGSGQLLNIAALLQSLFVSRR